MREKNAGSRVLYLDHLRAALVVLVVLHHVAVVYVGVVPFYYVEPPFNDPLAYSVLLAFVLMNQAWFMGALFFIAGYFTSASFDRSGVAAFLGKRLLRLGVPILVFVFVLGPLSSIGFYLMPTNLTGLTWPPAWSAYFAFLGLGPLWFAAMLLLFDLGYVVWRLTVGERFGAWIGSKRPPGIVVAALFVLGLTAASYLLRIVVPLGEEVHLLIESLDFPTIAYLPQYLSFFVIGALASRTDWLDSLTLSAGTAGLVIVVAAAVILMPLAMSGRMFVWEFTEPASGGGTLQSLVYALWDSITAAGMILGLISVFRRWFGHDGRVGGFLARNSYAVYILHVPVIVFAAYLLSGLDVPALAKFLLLAAIVVPISFAIASLLRRMIPFVEDVT